MPLLGSLRRNKKPAGGSSSGGRRRGGRPASSLPVREERPEEEAPRKQRQQQARTHPHRSPRYRSTGFHRGGGSGGGAGGGADLARFGIELSDRQRHLIDERRRAEVGVYDDDGGGDGFSAASPTEDEAEIEAEATDSPPAPPSPPPAPSSPSLLAARANRRGHGQAGAALEAFMLGAAAAGAGPPRLASPARAAARANREGHRKAGVAIGAFMTARVQRQAESRGGSGGGGGSPPRGPAPRRWSAGGRAPPAPAPAPQSSSAAGSKPLPAPSTTPTKAAGIPPSPVSSPTSVTDGSLHGRAVVSPDGSPARAAARANREGHRLAGEAIGAFMAGAAPAAARTPEAAEGGGIAIVTPSSSPVGGGGSRRDDGRDDSPTRAAARANHVGHREAGAALEAFLAGAVNPPGRTAASGPATDRGVGRERAEDGAAEAARANRAGHLAAGAAIEAFMTARVQRQAGHSGGGSLPRGPAPRMTLSKGSVVALPRSADARSSSVGSKENHGARIEKEMALLLKDIRRIGPTFPSPEPRCLFAEIFDDPEAEQRYEALVGTLKSAKKRGLVEFKGQMLLRGMHDNVVIGIAGETELLRDSDGGEEEKKSDGSEPRRPAPNGSRCEVVVTSKPRWSKPVSSISSVSTERKKCFAPPSVPRETAGGVYRSSTLGSTSSDVAKAMKERLDAEIARLPLDIQRIGTGEFAGVPRCNFGDLFDDEDVQNGYEAIVGTLKGAKKRGIVTFKGQMLLKGMHDKVIIEVVNT